MSAMSTVSLRNLAAHKVRLTLTLISVLLGTAFVADAGGTTVPSDFRCAVLDFVVDLYDAPCRDGGGADGSLVFRADPCTRAASRTPPRPSACAVGVAFAVT